MSAVELPELAAYQDQPRQAPAGRVAKTGNLRMRFVDRGDKTVLRELYRKAPMLVQQALYWDEALPDLACVYVISTSGCVLQGDRLTLEVTMDPGARAHVTTQSATKIHQMDANYAVSDQQFTLAEDAYLEYLPAITIPHRDSRFVTRTDIVIDESATLLLSEIVMPGRKYHAESEDFGYDLYSALLRARRPDGTRLFTEKIVIEPARSPVRRVGVMGRFDVFANAIVLTPPDRAAAILARTPAGLTDGVYSGASRLPGECGLIFKALGADSAPVRARVREFWTAVRQEVLGTDPPPEPLWG